jgi:enamine deaminase RidA (YjgF/YER057c/UK114 family)
LKEAGGELADIVRLRTFVTDGAYCEAVLKVQGEAFGAIRPAATIVVVSALLEPEMKVEIEATRGSAGTGLVTRTGTGFLTHSETGS